LLGSFAINIFSDILDERLPNKKVPLKLSEIIEPVCRTCLRMDPDRIGLTLTDYKTNRKTKLMGNEKEKRCNEVDDGVLCATVM
jgi:hypothetical protein